MNPITHRIHSSKPVFPHKSGSNSPPEAPLQQKEVLLNMKFKSSPKPKAEHGKKLSIGGGSQKKQQEVPKGSAKKIVKRKAKVTST